VPAARSLELKNILDEHKVQNERKTYAGQGHDIHRSQEKDVYARIHGWLEKYGVLKA